MPFVLADRVQEMTISTSGTGDITLNGPTRQMQSFLDGIGNGNTTDICILDGNGSDWEVCKDAVLSSGTVLSRGTFLTSSTGARLSLSARTHTVFATVPAERYIDLDAIEWNAGSVSALGGGLSVTNGTLSVAQEWSAGTVTALGGDLVLSSGTLSVTVPAQEWTAGTASAIGSGLTLSAGTLSATSSGSGTSGLYGGVISAAPSQTSTGLTTWLNQVAGSTVTNGPTGLTVYAPSNGNQNIISALKVAAPAAPYSITMLVSLPANTNRPSNWLVGWSDGTKCDTFMIQPGTAANHATWNSPSSFNAQTGITYPTDDPLWVKLRDDGTTFYVYTSAEGNYWTLLFSGAKSSGFLGSAGYSNIIFGTDCYNGAGIVSILAWEQGTS